jgi:hypothetical protein
MRVFSVTCAPFALSFTAGRSPLVNSTPALPSA